MRCPKWLAKTDLDLFPKNVRRLVVDVIALARTSAAYSRALDAESHSIVARMKAELGQTHQTIALLNDEIRIKDDRMARIPPHQRPHYPSLDRFAILKLRAARGWNLLQTAQRFLIQPETVAFWMPELDQPNSPLLKAPIPVNKLSDFSAYLVKDLKSICPAFGKKRIAHLLIQAGFKLCASSVGRILKMRPPPKPTSTINHIIKPSARKVAARYPHHVWHTDLTVVPTSGFWVPWFPFSLPQAFPFAYWVAFILDHFTRRLVAFSVFPAEPSAAAIKAFFQRACAAAGQTPKHLISDQGPQFTAEIFKQSCKALNVKQRFGAVGHYGSIAVIERFIRSFKDECVRFISVPLAPDGFRKEIECYGLWYNVYRPHERLKGQTPCNVYASANKQTSPTPMLPPTINSSSHSPCGPPQLVVEFLEGRHHLPIVSLRQAA